MQDEIRKTIAAARSGDRAALDSLFARHLPALTAFLRCKVDGELAQRESIRDLAQSVCREVIADLEAIEYRGDEAFRGWLFLQATRKILDRYRYHKRARRAGSKEVLLPEDDDAELLQQYASICTPSRHAAGKEQLARVEAAMRQLPEGQRDAVLMSRLGGIAYSEIAQQLGVTESAVRGLVARGLARVAELLGDEGA